MYRIKFPAVSEDGGEASGLFTNMYLMFLGNQDNPNRAQSIEETRTAIKLLDSMDAISKLMLVPDVGQVRVLADAGGDLILQEAEKALLIKGLDAYLEKAPFINARLGIKIRDLVTSAPKDEPPQPQEAPKLQIVEAEPLTQT
jgi:hypothetical protein